MQVGPVDHGVGLAEAGAEGIAERDARHHFAREAVHHDEVVDEDGRALDPLPDTQAVEHAEDVGAELDAGADLAELAGLLEDGRAHALARQSQGDGEPADTAAHDHHGPRIPTVPTHARPPFNPAPLIPTESLTAIRCKPLL